MSRSCRRRPDARLGWLALAAGLLWGCAVPANVIARSDDFVVVSAGSGDSLRSLAARFLGDPDKTWLIAEFNGIDAVTAGSEVVIPLRLTNPAGVSPDGYRKVAILAYHRFVRDQRSCDRLAVTARVFEQHLTYLKKNGFTVIGFSDLADFIEGKAPLPRKAVTLTMDDGYKSAYQIAYPMLRKFGFKATIFIYTDFIGAPAALSWAQMKEMVASGLIDVQPHSKSHSDLTLQGEDESDAAYGERIVKEVSYPSREIRKRLGIPVHTFAFPYGAENDRAIAAVEAAGYRLAATITRGGNPVFAHPYALRRSQIYCDTDLRKIAKRLDVYQKTTAR